jgi:hypothetical protein
MTTHLNQFTSEQRAALDLLRKTVHKFAMVDFDTIQVSDPHVLARGLADARTIVASDPDLLRECGRQMYTQFDLCSFVDDSKTREVLAVYRDDAQLSAWTVIALGWVARLAMSLADRQPATKH